ncbi:MAG: DUF418 domain-containing protein, partial [Mariniphaga sp.]|nr:DUF418 domain-containing protein [Mariniphaga sp.]
MKTLPTQSTDRIISLDVLRGFAVLGILIMNIQSFSMISSAYFFPTSFGDFTGANRWVWILSYVFGDLKFMTIFSILFGAGIILFTERLKAKGIKSISLHYRRIFCLLIFGLLHAYLLWYGDILVAYALCGMLVVLFRKMKPKKLIWLGLLFFSIATFLYFLSGFSMQFWTPESLTNFNETWQPGAETVNHHLQVMRGSWIEQMEIRVVESIGMQTYVFLSYFGWRCTGLMMIGMALFKLKILSAEKTRKFYFRMALIALTLGLTLVIFGVIQLINNGFEIKYSFFIGSQFNYWG